MHSTGLLSRCQRLPLSLWTTRAIASVKSRRGSASSMALSPFGLDAIDQRLPAGGLALGVLHEVASGGYGALGGAAAALFTAGIMTRIGGQILWCMTRRDRPAPALAQAGLHPDRVIYAEVGDEKSLLACVEEGLRHGGLGGVVGEIARLSMPVS